MRKLLFLTLTLFPLFASAISNSESIPYPFYKEDLSGETQMMPLHKGEESYQLRLELIQKAQKTIDVEFYIYNMDMAAKIFTHELIKAAQRGVKIRILVDKFATELNSFVAKELSQYGIELKFYNTGVFLKLGLINYRNHRKLIVIDGEEAITGGRNLANDYFNLDQKYNYEDRDVYIKGPLVEVMRDSFNEFYAHKISHFVKRPTRPMVHPAAHGSQDGVAEQREWDNKDRKVKEFLQETEEELRYRQALEKVGTEQLSDNNLYPCPVATFVTDAPGGPLRKTNEDYRQNYRNVRKTFLDKILPIDKSLTLSSPYFIPNDRNEYIFDEILHRGVEINLYTNSLRSTDALFMSANLYMHLHGWLQKGMKVFFNDGQWSDRGEPALESAKTAHWGTHAKTHIYETSEYTEVMIGTYNIDNRSDYFNTELAVFCKGNDDFTRNVKADVMDLAKRGLKVEGLGHALDRNGGRINITGASFLKQLKMKFMTLPSWLITNLL